uniref:BAG family molecular chaperone regulator 8, chloroplastic n=1 Tax=Cajanus cajan TaxID=3821 RepID=A0A151TCG9_CAJCA|nr:hypothetical protein KK1_019330 [Cajanus cajan]
MASHCHHQTPPPTTTHCYCHCYNPSYTCCTPLSNPPQHHLLQAIASLLSQPQPQPQPHPTPIPIPIPIPTQHYTKSSTHTQNHHFQHQHQPHSTISSLLHRIESLEASLNHYTRHSLRHAAARVIQTHFRSFLARRSRTLTHLKHLASIKSTLNALKSSLSDHTHVDFASLSLKAVNLLLELDSIQDCDPMIVDGKRSISRDLVRFLDSIEEVALKRHVLCVREAKTVRSVTNVLIGGRNEVSPNKNGVLLHRQGVQPRVKKSVRFAENGNIYEVYNSGDVTCSDGTCSSSDEQGEVLENVGGAVDDGVDSSQGAEDDEEVLVVESGALPRSSDDGERNTRIILENDGRNVVKGQLQANQERLLFSAPLPLKMENRSGLKKSKGVKILT